MKYNHISASSRTSRTETTAAILAQHAQSAGNKELTQVATLFLGSPRKHTRTYRERSDGVGMRDGLQGRIQVVHQRHSGGDVEVGDHVLGDVVQVLHQGAQRVA
jgi:hypothetical protein